jgi:hypothetical protein
VLPLARITVVRIKLVRRTEAIYRARGGLVVGPSDRPCHSRDRSLDAHRLPRAISDFHPPAHWPPNEPTLRIGSAIAVVSPVAIAAPAPANFLPLQYVLSL